MTEGKRLKMALVGCGGIAQAHWNGIQQHAPQILITAVVDTDNDRAAAMAAKTGGRAFSSLAEALSEGNIDAIDIMLPHALHEDAAIRGFAAGKHVILEKPMAPTLDACERILAAARQAGTVFMVAEQAEYWSDAIMVRQLVQAGAIGDILSAAARFAGTAGPAAEQRPWRFDKFLTGGGITIDGGSHWIRPLRMWLGEVVDVVAVTGRPLAAMEGESLTTALLRFDSGTTAMFSAMKAGSVLGPGEEFRITGTDGELVIERGRAGRLLRYGVDYPDGITLMDNKGEHRRAAFGFELRDFANAILTGSSLQASPEYSLGELRTALAIYRSAETHRWEPVWDNLL